MARRSPVDPGWAEFYDVHAFHGPPLPRTDGRGKRARIDSDHGATPTTGEQKKS